MGAGLAEHVRRSGFLGRAVRLALQTGQISPAEVHRHGVTARDLSQSNAVILVEGGNGRGVVVKDMTPRRDAAQGAPAHERAVYRAAARDPRLAVHLPQLRADPPGEDVLLIEGLVSSCRIDQLPYAQGPGSTELATRLGTCLGAWHRDSAGLPGFAPADPWLLHLDGTGRLPVLDRDPKLAALADRIVADPLLGAGLERLRAAWRDDTVIHGDARFANVMVCLSPHRVRLIDWETAGRGDGRWDVAGIAQEYVSHGLAAGAPPGAPAPEDLISVFTAAYGLARGRQCDPDALAPFLAGRLVLRALQLVNWPDVADDAIDAHLERARRALDPAVVRV